MKKHPFQLFVDLIEFDQLINKLSREKEATLQELTQLQDAIKHVEDGVLAAQHRIRSSQKEVQELELEIKELEAAEAEKKARLDDVSGYKEYQAVKQELDQVQAGQVAAEKELLESWKNLETAQKNLEVLNESNKSKLKELQSTYEHKERHLQSLDTEYTQRVGQRAALEEGVPPEWLDKYAVMRTRVVNPVVPVMRDSCSACYHSLTNQELSSVRARALIQCKGCFRLLYLPVAMEGLKEGEIPSSRIQ